MKKLLSVLATVVIGSSLIGNAVASDAQYTVRGALKSPAAGRGSFSVTLFNNTYDSYDIHAVFYNYYTSYSVTKNLGPVRSGNDGILFNVVSPDNKVCLEGRRTYDGAYVDIGCFISAYEVNLYPNLNQNKDETQGKKPTPLVQSIRK